MAVRPVHRHHNYGGGPPPRGPSALSRLKVSFLAMPRVLQGLIVLEVVLYLAALIAGDNGTSILLNVALIPSAVTGLEIWRLVTYWPFHAGSDPLGVIFDVVILWSLGGIFARRWRANHFLFFFLAGCVGAAVVNVLLYLILPGTFAGAQLGSSGGSFALFIAFYFVFGEARVSVFGSMPMKGKWLFYLLFGLQVLFFFAGVNPAFGIQLGGTLTGWLLVTGRWRPHKFKGWLERLQSNRKTRQREAQKSRFRIIH